MSKFTEGPWKIGGVQGQRIETNEGRKSKLIATLSGETSGNKYRYTETDRANARLISKAPAMYELIKKLLAERIPATLQREGAEILRYIESFNIDKGE